MIDKSVYVTDTQKAPKVKRLLFVLKYTKTEIPTFGEKVIRVINSLVFLPWVPEPLQISTYTNSFNLQHSLKGNHLKIKLKHWLYLYISFHHEAGFENSLLNVLTEWKSWKPVAPLQAWASLGRLSRHPALTFPQPLDQPALSSSPKCLPSSGLQERGTESWKLQIDSGKGRKAKWPMEGSSHQSHLALPGMGTSSPHGPHFLTVLSGGLPDKRRLRFDSFRLLLNPIQTIIRINCVTPSLLCSTSMKRNSGPRPYPINKAD